MVIPLRRGPSCLRIPPQKPRQSMLLRVPEGDGKEREYVVISMKPPADVCSARAFESKQP